MDRKANLLTLFNPKINIRSIWVRPEHNRFTAIDGLRALSILWVIAFHIIWYTGFVLPADQFYELSSRPEFALAANGSFGVDIFFTISGFLIGHLLFREFKYTNSLNFKQFYLRRALRIFPAYFFVLIILALLIPNNVENIGYNIIYISNFLPVLEQFMPWSWSLAIEEQFYTVFPILLLVLFRFPKWVLSILFALLVLAIAIRYQIIYSENLIPKIKMHPAYNPDEFWRFFDVLYGKTYTRFGGILIGVIVAYSVVYTRVIDWLAHHAWARRLMLLICVVGIVSHILPKSDIATTEMTPGLSMFIASYRYLFNLYIAGIVLFCLTPSGKFSWISRILSARFWYPIAQLSYSAYLVHPIIVMVSLLVFYQNGAPSQVDMIAIMLGLTALIFFVSALVYLFIEKPFMNMRYYFSQQSTHVEKADTTPAQMDINNAT